MIGKFTRRESTYYAVYGYIAAADSASNTVRKHISVDEKCGLTRSAVADMLSALPFAMKFSEQSAFLNALDINGVAFFSKSDAPYHCIYAEIEQ
ncbi:hypothetical protein FACS1894103_7110 [Campylobacterota bacterium]|nr:hypothetical protein FACS1894103_7110 [Campylobacterota bacterium]